jgi:hypothetical protein
MLQYRLDALRLKVNSVDNDIVSIIHSSSQPIFLTISSSVIPLIPLQL